MVLRIQGKGARKSFNQEAGGHRWQRIPPTERRGRVHTSTITVALLDDRVFGDIELKPEDLKWQATRGSGAGGQHRNKTDSAVQLWHLPSKLMVRAEGSRHQWQNRQEALYLLRLKLWQQASEKFGQKRNQERKDQIGRGERGDKRRTIRLQDGVVTDHVAGWRTDTKKYLRGEW